MANKEDIALDWDSALTSEDIAPMNQHLPDGEYYFKVVKFEKARFNGSAKMAPSPMAKITIEVSTPDDEELQNTWTENLILNRKMIWKTHDFFVSCGLIQRGFEGVLPWSKVLGSGGRAKVTTRSYEKDGEKKDANQVDKWLPPEEEPAEEASGKQEEDY